jgi:exodeoxyribonuclease V gamma subunit
VIELYDQGRREPLPLYCATSAAWVEATRVGDDRVGTARRVWDGGGQIPGERADPAHRMVLGGERSFDEVLAAPPTDDECGPGWELDESTRVGRLAHRLWDSLYEHEILREL